MCVGERVREREIERDSGGLLSISQSSVVVVVIVIRLSVSILGSVLWLLWLKEIAA